MVRRWVVVVVEPGAEDLQNLKDGGDGNRRCKPGIEGGVQFWR